MQIEGNKMTVNYILIGFHWNSDCDVGTPRTCDMKSTKIQMVEIDNPSNIGPL